MKIYVDSNWAINKDKDGEYVEVSSLEEFFEMLQNLETPDKDMIICPQDDCGNVHIVYK